VRRSTNESSHRVIPLNASALNASPRMFERGDMLGTQNQSITVRSRHRGHRQTLIARTRSITNTIRQPTAGASARRCRGRSAIPADAVLSHRSGLSHAAQRVRPYTLPRIDIQISGAIESIPGPMLLANYVASTAVVAPSLGRALVGGAQNITANIVPLGTLLANG
jgi:hypothetical protein